MSGPFSLGDGGCVGDASSQFVADVGSSTGFSRIPVFARHQGQVGHRGRQVQLEPGLDPPEVAGLANPQLHQPGQPVLHHHPPLTVPGKGFALLQGAGLLQQCLLGMHLHRSAQSRRPRHALGPQLTCSAHRRIEPEALQPVNPSCGANPPPQMPGNLPRRAGAGPRFQVY